MATAVQKIASLSNIRDIPFNKLVLSQACAIVWKRPICVELSSD